MSSGKARTLFIVVILTPGPSQVPRTVPGTQLVLKKTWLNRTVIKSQNDRSEHPIPATDVIINTGLCFPRGGHEPVPYGTQLNLLVFNIGLFTLKVY